MAMANSRSYESSVPAISQAELVSLLITEPTVLLETLTELAGEPFRLEPYQIRLLNDKSLFRIVSKSRQIGFSTAIAGEGFSRALVAPLIKKPYTANYVSINQKEAGDKTAIASDLYFSLPDELKETDPPLKPPLWKNSSDVIEFGRPPYQGTLVSQPASAAIRGGRKDIYFDEFAHIRDATKLYKAALPAISRGDSRFTIVSTPLGQSGLFYDIFVDTMSYSNWSRHSVPWWEASVMVRPDALADAMAEAPDLPTHERVHKYGSMKLLEIYTAFGGDLIGFQTEYEALFVDEAEAYFPWDLIIDCQSDQPMWRDWPTEYKPDGWLSIGVDLAKERDQTVITVVEQYEVDEETKYKVLMVKATQDSYDDQFTYLKGLIEKVKPNRVSIDATGVGQMFVERAKRELVRSNVEGVIFTQMKKERWATTFKGDMQLRNIAYPTHQDLMRQIHGIRRTKTENGFYKFSGTHDDYFWSLMLAMYGEGRVTPRISFLG